MTKKHILDNNVFDKISLLQWNNLISPKWYDKKQISS